MSYWSNPIGETKTGGTCDIKVFVLDHHKVPDTIFILRTSHLRLNVDLRQVQEILPQLALDVIQLSPAVIADTLGAVLKYQDDIAKLHGSEAKRILDQAKASLEPA